MQLDKPIYLGSEDTAHSGEFWVETLGKTLVCSKPNYCDVSITVEGIEYPYGGYIWTSSRGDRGKKCYVFEPQTQRQQQIKKSSEFVAREEQRIIDENYETIMSEWQAHPHYKYDNCTIAYGEVVPHLGNYFESYYKYTITSPSGEVIESGIKSDRTITHLSFTKFAKNWVDKYQQAQYSKEYDAKRKAEAAKAAAKTQTEQEAIKADQDQLWSDWLDLAEWHEISVSGLSGANPEGKKYTLAVYVDINNKKGCITFKLYLERCKTLQVRCHDRQSMLDAYTDYAKIIKDFCTPKRVVEKPIKRVIPDPVRK